MAVVFKKLAYEGDVILKAFIAAKGDLIAASANDTPLILGVGANDTVLVADSAQSPGIKWAGVPSGGTPAAHATSHKNGGSDELLLHELGEPTSAVDFDLQQATDLVVFTVANESTRDALSVADTAVGQLVFATTELSLAICTESAA